jgi:hypothetical protein
MGFYFWQSFMARKRIASGRPLKSVRVPPSDGHPAVNAVGNGPMIARQPHGLCHLIGE